MSYIIPILIMIALAVAGALVFNHGAHNLKDFPKMPKK